MQGDRVVVDDRGPHSLDREDQVIMVTVSSACTAASDCSKGCAMCAASTCEHSDTCNTAQRAKVPLKWVPLLLDLQMSHALLGKGPVGQPVLPLKPGPPHPGRACMTAPSAAQRSHHSPLER